MKCLIGETWPGVCDILYANDHICIINVHNIPKLLNRDLNFNICTQWHILFRTSDLYISYSPQKTNNSRQIIGSSFLLWPLSTIKSVMFFCCCKYGLSLIKCQLNRGSIPREKTTEFWTYMSKYLVGRVFLSHSFSLKKVCPKMFRIGGSNIDVHTYKSIRKSQKLFLYILSKPYENCGVPDFI